MSSEAEPRWTEGRPKRRGRTTREGKVFNFVTLGVGIAAVNTGNNLLYLMLGLMLSLLLLSMVLSELALRGLRLRRRLPQRAYAGTECLVELVTANDKRRMPSYSLEVEDVGDEQAERRCYFLKVAAGADQVAAYRRRPSRRGRLALRALRVTTRYPFGLIEKTKTYALDGELLVYPEIHPVDPRELGRHADGAETPAGHVGPGTELAGLRSYRAGDEARVIHWRRTASLGRLVATERERDAVSRLTIVLDEARPADASPAWEDAFERAISRAASLATASLGRGVAVELRTRTGASPLVLPSGSADPILRYLALLGAVPLAGAPPLPAVAGLRVEVTPAPRAAGVEGAA